MAYLKRELTPENLDRIFFYALQHANLAAVKLALDAGANPNEPVGLGSDSPRAPLLWTIDSSATPDKRLKVLKQLLERGADPNKPFPQQVYYGSSPSVEKRKRLWKWRGRVRFRSWKRRWSLQGHAETSLPSSSALAR